MKTYRDPIQKITGDSYRAFCGIKYSKKSDYSGAANRRRLLLGLLIDKITATNLWQAANRQMICNRMQIMGDLRRLIRDGKVKREGYYYWRVD